MSSFLDTMESIYTFEHFSVKQKGPPEGSPKSFTSYKNTYFSTNRTANTYIRGVIFLALPVNRLITT